MRTRSNFLKALDNKLRFVLKHRHELDGTLYNYKVTPNLIQLKAKMELHQPYTQHDQRMINNVHYLVLCRLGREEYAEGQYNG